jgi:class 3 adenylate cyclase
MDTWGDPEELPDYMLGARASDDAFRVWMARYLRLSASPSAAAHLLRMNTEMDTRAALKLINVPTLCLYKTEDQDVKIEEGRWIAGQIPNAKLVELPGNSHLFYADDPRPFVDEIEEFITGHRESAAPERVLATALYTDITGSTARATSMGDREWAHLLEKHNRIVRQEITKHRGNEVDNAGDGFLSIFDGPGRAIRAAAAIREAVRPLDLVITAGIHTGEVEILDDNYAGLALHIGARIASIADPGEILISRTVKDLVVGSDFQFDSRGSHSLKGVQGDWEVYALVD